MASNINTSNIDANFPVQGEDNPSQGFRDNYSYIKIALDTAASEITDLQDLAGVIATTGTLGNIIVGNNLSITPDGILSASSSLYTLPNASSSILGGVKIGSGINVAGDGTISVSSGGSGNGFGIIAVSGQNNVSATTFADTLNIVAGNGISIATNSGSKSVTITNAQNPIQTRTTVSVTVNNLPSGSTTTTAISGYKGYLLYKMATSTASWVRLYSSVAARSADSTRTIDTNPAVGSGVIAEFVTTQSSTVLITPGVFGFSSETVPTTSIPVTITNLYTTTSNITVTLTLLQLEG